MALQGMEIARLDRRQWGRRHRWGAHPPRRSSWLRSTCASST